MDELKRRLEDDLRVLADGVKIDFVRAVFCVSITDDGSSQLVLVDPEDRESLIIAINEELTRLLGSPHHVVSAEKLERFFVRHKISPLDLFSFAREEEQQDEL